MSDIAGRLAELRNVAGSDAYDRSVAARAQIVVWFLEGHSKADITRMAKTTRPTVDKWIKRYEDGGAAALESYVSPGAPRTIPPRIRSRVLALTRMHPPAELGIDHWSSTAMAGYIKKTEGVRVSHTWIANLWRDNDLQPWRQGTFKISTDPEFEAKVRDLVRVYGNTEAGEAVVSVDVKSGIQALNRTQPMLPVDFGKSAKRTHDYVRNGTTDLYAAFNVKTGKVISRLSGTHNAGDFVALLRKIDREHADACKIHVVLDNASVHTSEEAEQWLSAHPRFALHFTPKGASWMNQVETWFGILTRQAIRCASFVSVPHLNRAISNYTASWNQSCKPFKWTATADSIIEKVRRIEGRFARLVKATEIAHVTSVAA